MCSDICSTDTGSKGGMKLPSIFGLFCTKGGPPAGGVKDAGTTKGQMDSRRKNGHSAETPVDSRQLGEGDVQWWEPTQGQCTPLSNKNVEQAMHEVSSSVRPFDNRRFKMQKTLQDAIRNHGRVDLMQDGNSLEGHMVAVKRMPTRWVKQGPKEFNVQYPTASERPWYDMGLVRSLGNMGCPFVTDLIGVFRDAEETFVVMGLCTEGDLFGWCDCEPAPGRAREALMPPITHQMFTAVRWLHELGIAHRDLSLENILLTTTPTGELQLKLIDFGMATLTRHVTQEVRGKQSYQAPEMHEEAEFDCFLADEFAIGVVLFAMAAQDYPWTGTAKGSCQLFEYVSMFGLKRFLEKRKLRKGNGEHLIDVFTPQLTQMLEGLLEVQPRNRATFGETTFRGQDGHRSVWDMPWTKTFITAK